MKATALIALLQSAVEEHGDQISVQVDTVSNSDWMDIESTDVFDASIVVINTIDLR